MRKLSVDKFKFTPTARRLLIGQDKWWSKAAYEKDKAAGDNDVSLIRARKGISGRRSTTYALEPTW
jgi:hypothetical protein